MGTTEEAPNPRKAKPKIEVKMVLKLIKIIKLMIVINNDTKRSAYTPSLSLNESP